MATRKKRTLQSLEHDIRNALAAMESAGDEKAAAKAYALLRHDISEHIRRSGDLRSDFYKLRNTVTRQAKDISDLAIESVIGEAAPGEPPPSPAPIPEWPDVLTVQNSPDFFFVRLSYGLVNIRHIVELDVKARTLYTSHGTRHLKPADVRTLIAQLKLYPAPRITAVTEQQRQPLEQLRSGEDRSTKP